MRVTSIDMRRFQPRVSDFEERLSKEVESIALHAAPTGISNDPE